MAKVKLGNVKGSKGDKGDRGSLWRVSDKMTGQGTSGTAFPGAGFEDSVVNDICLNPATFDLYRCQTAGNAAAAKWVWECNIKGAPGPKGDKGDPTTVDAVLSESSANPIQNKAVATKFKDVQDSLGRFTKSVTICGTKTVSCDSTNVQLFTKQELDSLASSVGASAGTAVISVTNADWSKANVVPLGVVITDSIVVRTDALGTGSADFNYSITFRA